ncbi:MAG: hypothetical protein AB7S39_22910 [Gemmatimonadales bacterium]
MMRSWSLALGAVAASMIAGSAVGQAAPARPPALPSMLRQWAGEWRGSGWLLTVAGERVEFDLAESVSEKAGGTVLLLDGHGIRTDSVGRGRTTHDGISLIFPGAAGHYRWHGHEAATGLVDTDATLLADGVEWSIHPAGSVTVRFTIALDSTTWHERGEVSTDGATWTRIMEMTLRRAR